MNEPMISHPESHPESAEETPGNLSGDTHEDALERAGTVSARHGRINWWLWAVYLIMLGWALYYGFEYWDLPGHDALGPGLGDY